jgi:hypothetical protein
MTLHDLPIVGQVLESGASDPVFDGLLLAGPAVILLLAVLGRSVLTVALGIGYLAVFVSHVLTKAHRP